MSGEIETVPVEQRKRRPIPIFEDRFAQYGNTQRNQPYIDLSKPYLRKNILAEIGNNLNELVEIKTGGRSIDSTVEERKTEKTVMIEEKKTEVPIIYQPQETISKVEPKIELKIEPKVEPKKDEIKKDEIKIGINNLVPEKNIENKNNQIKTEKKTIKRKVNYMNDEDPNMSSEMRRRMRKDEIKEIQDEEKTKEEIRKSVELATQNRGEIEKLNLKLDENKTGIQKELNTKFGNLDNKFGNLDNKFSEIGTKLKETCDGIECLKKDIKKQELAECPDCGGQSVPYKASFCPDCGVKINSWTEEDGVTPLKSWKPNWAK